MFSLQWNEEEARKYREEYAREEGRSEGRSEGKGEMILNMLKEHMHIDVIERISGWTADQIRALAQKNGLAVE